MPDIRVCHELPAKAEVYEIASHLDLDVNATIGVLVRVWIWADQHTSDGWSMHSPKLLESIIGVPGLIQALESVGWLELPGSGFRFPGLDRYTGDGRTSKARRRVARERSVGAVRGPDGRFAPKNPTSPKPDRHLRSDDRPDRTVPVPVPDRTEQELTSSEKFLASRDERVDAVLAPWKEARLIGSPQRAREAVWRALEDIPMDTLLEASNAYLGSPAAQDKKFTCRSHTFFGEKRYLLDPEEWYRGESDTKSPTSWDALEATHE